MYILWCGGEGIMWGSAKFQMEFADKKEIGKLMPCKKKMRALAIT
jgi:hypothetical protein